IARVFLWWGKDNKAKGGCLVVQEWSRNGGVSYRRNGGRVAWDDVQYYV
nr:hypothetical protein [Tanacetum cinerariifolium]